MIKERNRQEALLKLAIAHNPHSKNPRELWDMLKAEADYSYVEHSTLDKASFNQLRDRLRGSKKIKVE